MPAATSEPGRRTLPPDLVGARIATAAGTSEAPAGASVSSTGTTVSAPAGIIAPVMIRSAVPGPTSSIRRPAGRHLAQDPEHHRPIDGRPGHVGGPDREAVHGAVRPGRQGQGGADGLGEGQARGIGEVDASRPAGPRCRRAPGAGPRRAGSGRAGRHGSAPCGGAGYRAMRPGSSGYAARAGGPAIPSSSRQPGAGALLTKGAIRRVAYDSGALRRRGPANVRREPVQMARPRPTTWPLSRTGAGTYARARPPCIMRTSSLTRRCTGPRARPPHGELDDHRNGDGAPARGGPGPGRPDHRRPGRPPRRAARHPREAAGPPPPQVPADGDARVRGHAYGHPPVAGLRRGDVLRAVQPRAAGHAHGGHLPRHGLPHPRLACAARAREAPARACTTPPTAPTSSRSRRRTGASRSAPSPASASARSPRWSRSTTRSAGTSRSRR